MRDALAERLLANVMEWSPEDIARERPILQAMATYKYDEYQQFAPGMRFVERLALWLSQFKTKEERQVAYDFVRKRLIFYSSAEMIHLVSIAFPDHILPLLFSRAAQSLKIAEKSISRIANSIEFRELQRRCLFLGLSDGAHIDIFRRSNPDLTHEQILQTYEISTGKAQSMKNELNKDIEQILNKDKQKEKDAYFRVVFLLDDFSGSGMSYIRKDISSGRFEGKIAKFYEQLVNPESSVLKLISLKDLHICVVFYIATEKSRSHITELLHELSNQHNIEWSIQIVQLISNDFMLQNSVDAKLLELTESYYDPSVEDEHTRKGGTDVKRGFARCSLPLVLSHNTPNNSIFLLWAEEKFKVQGLFPRVSRHRSEP